MGHVLLQTEMDCYAGQDGLAPPRSPLQNQHQQTTIRPINSGFQTSSGLFEQPSVGLLPRSCHADQVKNSVFSTALSSPVRRSLQPYHIANGSDSYVNGAPSTGNAGIRNHDLDQNQDTNSLSSNDTCMDIHTDSPHPQSY